MATYTSKVEYLREIHQLHLRAKRSGWNIATAHRTQIASWLGISADKMLALNREYGISLDDIRAGSL